MTTHTSTYLRRVACAARLAAVGALAVGTMILTATAGNAIPESTIANECIAAGGTYTTTSADGKRYSKCCYRDIGGKKHCDNYVDGTYTNTTDTLEQPPTSPPPPPPGGVVAPPATAVEQQPAPPRDFRDPNMTLYLPPPPPNEAARAP